MTGVDFCINGETIKITTKLKTINISYIKYQCFKRIKKLGFGF
jgi:hypothetical protein